MGPIRPTTAAIPPPVEPPADDPCRHGVDVFPCRALSVVPDIEYSGAAERPRILTPEALSISHKYVSCFATMPRHNRLPHSTLRPASWPNRSLITNGTPRNGPLPSVRSSRS